MVNFNDPIVQQRVGQAAVDILFACFGAYLWEILASFDFDLMYIRREKRFTLAAAAYFSTRYLLLICYVMGIYMTNIWTSNPDCMTINYVFMFTAYATSATASALLVLRVRALSERNVYVTAFLLAIYAGDWALMLWQVARTKSVFIPAVHSCATVEILAFQINTTMAFTLDVVCLVFMMYFILQAAHTKGSDMWSLMRDQGLVYVITIAVVYIVCVVMAWINLHIALTQALNVVGLFTLVVCATRLHRRLIMYHSTGSSRGVTTGGAGGYSVSAPKFAPRRRSSRRQRLSASMSR
ncbi:hypothetical protein BKA62DRAFT_405395 [Auriculariales sp. MPI-PUGE-AT-0066]|nr:hypothetical protein BKA62DRAFT_405395 [Auriculariales sp. MPI-PUGE-AT-0066]